MKVYHGDIEKYDEKAYRDMAGTLSLTGKRKVESSKNELLRRQRIVAYSLLARYQGKAGFSSISHSGRLVYVAVADVPVGIDVEEIARIRPKQVKRLADSHFFTEEERKRLRVANVEGFLRVWTMKEAMTKLTGVPLAKMLGSVDYYAIMDRDGQEDGEGAVTFHYAAKEGAISDGAEQKDRGKREWLVQMRQWKEDGGIVTVCLGKKGEKDENIFDNPVKK